MLVEHVAFAVNDPEVAAAWYCRHLGMAIVRRGGGNDIFVADGSGRVVFQLEDARLAYPNSGGKQLDFRAQDPRVLHLGFVVEDVAAVRKRLLSAGATPDGEIMVTKDGDEMTAVRDPWGLCIQLVKRKNPFF